MGGFAFLLPVIMAGFACAFGAVWRWGAAGRAALFWSLGYGFGVVAFTAPLLDRWLGEAGSALIADPLFAASFFCFGQALVERAALPPRRRLRLAIAGTSTALCWFAVLVRHDLPLELVASDVGCSLLIAVPLLDMRRRLAAPIDKAVFAISAAVMLDNLLRTSAVLLLVPADGFALLGTDYGWLMQTTAAVFGMAFGLVALTAVLLDAAAAYRAEATRDPLTGAFNRRGFDEQLARRGQDGWREGCLVVCDIDRFKRVNDRFGHAAGDRAIRAIALALVEAQPPGAVTARFGGEEFATWLPGRGEAAATLFANTVRRMFAGRDWAGDAIEGCVTASFGLTAIHAADRTLAAALDRADQALYDAKQGGRDRVAMRRAAPPIAPAPARRLAPPLAMRIAS